ncbi:5'-3' exonuclease H3TH domain-containing protein [Brevibacterium sp. Marseille-P9724]|uniref:5'-3' exonuclease H3TH domain-containing protein n=1 Tax=Brevibacterium sp. Marseille-P9724 TaxID=2614125 RepID=UPI00125F974B|nr:5'-3' exonuclease H3TH domain-containing protein [Brevibacterium sp. Marseille-P9724]
MSRLVVLDTPALYYRSFYALPSSITASDGTPVGALRGLLDTIAGLAEDLATTRIVAAMDGDWRPSFRTAILPEYKAQRVQDEETGSETPDDLKPQIPLIREALRLAGIPVLEIPDTEADDIIGSFAAQMGPDDELVVVSPDRDLISVLRADRRIQLHRPRPKGQWAPLTYADVPAEYGVKGGEPYRQMAALRGDPSDGLAGVPGIGEKTAAKLLTGYGGLDELFRAAYSGAKDHGLSPKRAAALIEHEDAVRRAEEVMTVLQDIDVLPAARDAAGVPQRMNSEALIAFGARWGAERATARLVRALGDEAPPAPDEPSPAAGRQSRRDQLPEFAGPSWTTAELWGFDLETTGLDPQTVHVVTAACVRLGRVDGCIQPLEIRTWLADPGIEIPEAASSVHGITSDYAHKHGADRTAVVTEVIACLDSIRRRGGCVVGHNIVYDLTVLEAERRRLGLSTAVADVLPPIFDTLVLDREIDRFRRGKRTLSDLCAAWDVELDNHHDALADAAAAGCILWAMADKHEAIAKGSGAQLHAAQIEWKRAQAADLEEFLRSKGRRATINPDWPLEILS